MRTPPDYATALSLSITFGRVAPATSRHRAAHAQRHRLRFTQNDEILV
jgi:hypothetical protein